MSLLSVRNLEKRFAIRGGILRGVKAWVRAVNGVSFELEPGKTLGVVGESGCGKSTLGRAILQLDPPTSGEVLFQGESQIGRSRSQLMPFRREAQMVFQDAYEALNARHTVGRILTEPFEIHQIGTPHQHLEWAAGLLERVGLPAESIDRYPHEFSGGQRQRIGIARAIALEPQLLVCDEPVSALDVSVQSQIMNLLMDLQRERNLAMVFIAHDLAVVKHLSHEIAVMYLGSIVEIGPAQALFNAPKHPYTRALLDAIPRVDVTQEQPLKPLEGDVPSPINLPSGCAFRTRCPHAQPSCAELTPTLEGDDHRVACHRAADLSL
ncbi:MAG: ABC transporter ATP-binding protein [Litorivicinus sp.]